MHRHTERESSQVTRKKPPATAKTSSISPLRETLLASSDRRNGREIPDFEFQTRVSSSSFRVLKFLRCTHPRDGIHGGADVLPPSGGWSKDRWRTTPSPSFAFVEQ